MLTLERRLKNILLITLKSCFKLQIPNSLVIWIVLFLLVFPKLKKKRLLESPIEMRLGTRLDMRFHGCVCVFILFFFFLLPAPLALFMGHEQCTKANEQCLKFGGVNGNLKIIFLLFSVISF